MNNHKVYVAGKIAGCKNYMERFAAAKDKLCAMGFVVLCPADLPLGMTHADYMRICFAEIDTSDAVYFLPNYLSSDGARLELLYCKYTGKRAFTNTALLGSYFSQWEGMTSCETG